MMISCIRTLTLCVMGTVFLFITATLPSFCVAQPFGYNNPPPLPQPVGTVINVSNTAQLVSAVGSLKSNQTILIAAGTYNLAGVVDALYLPQGISHWAIRGATGLRDDVIIQGNGMNGSVQFGFWIGNSPDGMIADLTIRNIRYHGVIGNIGAHNILHHNLRMVDIGDQFIKYNPQSFGVGNNNGTVEYSVFEYSLHENAGGTPDYTNGVDVHGGSNWKIRFNLFRKFLHRPAGGLSGPAVLMWNGSTNAVVEGNTFIDCARGIALGLIDNASGNDNSGGIISNNFFFRGSGLNAELDVPIAVNDSPSTVVLHNTSYVQDTYPNAVEYRFASTKNTVIRNNLLNKVVASRDGASGAVSNNVTNATASLFVDVNAGDLHLRSSAAVAIDKATRVAEVPTDIDGEVRPDGTTVDLGADEFSTTSGPSRPSAPSNLRAL